MGARYEEAAVDYLQTRGLKIIERNYRCRFSEIDIIGKDDEYLVFIEVKYRSDSRYGYGAEAVNFSKQEKIRRGAQYYLNEKRIVDAPCRFDVISITGKEFVWLKDAF